jgi:hypothetical protein
MLKPSSRFRLQSSAFTRNDETEKINPKRMIFLSVEGDETERTYFQNLNEYLDTIIMAVLLQILALNSGFYYIYVM